MGSFEGNSKEKWLPVLTMDFMSSDESATDDGKEVLVTKPLQWESVHVTQFKRSLDDAVLEKKSSLSKRQMKTRKRGMPSDRPKPSGDYPSWAFAASSD